MNTQKTNLKNEYLEQLLNALKEQYPESEYEYEINLELGFIFIKGYDIEICIEINEYQAPTGVFITKIDENNEIITPESCHDCSEDCPFYNAQNEECLRTDDIIDKEIAEWRKTLFENDYITIARTIAEKKCYLDIPHYHYFQAYTIILRKGFTVSDIIAIEQLFDILISIVEKPEE
jgi:hypothetical protein